MEQNKANIESPITLTEKQIKKRKRASKLINYYKKINNLLLNALSQTSGFLPGLGPIKSMSEGIIWKDVGIIIGLKIRNKFIKNKKWVSNNNDKITIREMKTPERLLKTLAGVSWLTGYYIFFRWYFSPTGLSLEEWMNYIGLETLNIVLYSTSLIAALGMKEAVKHTKESVKKKTQKIGKIAKRKEVEENKDL